VTADFGYFREVKHLLIIFSLYHFEFHTKILIFTVFEMSNFVLTKQHLREVLIFCFNWKKSAAEVIKCLSKFMVTLLQLINYVGNGFDVSRMEISALKTSLALDSQKIRRQRIRGITRRRSEQEELTKSLGVTQQAVSVPLRAMEIIQKQGNWMPYELKPRNVERRFHLRTVDSKTTEKIFFALDCDWR